LQLIAAVLIKPIFQILLIVFWKHIINKYKMKIISFYSYKGGAGRTTCTANFVYHYAKNADTNEKNPVILIDMDVDSAGLTNFINHSDRTNQSVWNIINILNENKLNLSTNTNLDILLQKDKKGNISNLFIESLINYIKSLNNPQNDFDIKLINELKKCNDIRESLNNYIDNLDDDTLNEYVEVFYKSLIKRELGNRYIKNKIESAFPAFGLSDVSEYFNCDERSILFLGASQISDEVYNYDTACKRFNATIEALEAHFKGNLTIVIDSSSGCQPSALIAHEVSDVLIYCMRLTRQFRSGTQTHLKYMFERFFNERDIDNIPKVIILPVAVPKYTDVNHPLALKRDNAMNNMRAYMDNINKQYETQSIIQFVSDNDNNKDDSNCIQEVEIFKWNEQILKQSEYENFQDDEKNAYENFEKLAFTIKNI